MAHFSRHFFLRVVSILLFAGSFFSGECYAQQQCLLVSDIHLNPFYVKHNTHFAIDTVLMGKLIGNPVDKWAGILDAYSKQSDVNEDIRGYDGNYALLKWSLDNMYAQLSKPAFIVITGDFIWHEKVEVDKKGDTIKLSMKPYEALVKKNLLKEKTLQFIAWLFAQKFPGVPIIPALGNNDTQKDYEMPKQPFLDAFAGAWGANNQQIASSPLFKSGGYYTCQFGTSPEFVVMNTTILSNQNNGKDSTITNAMLKWMGTELAKPGQKVWIISHILPGDNMQPAYTNQVTGMVANNVPRVKVYLAGHTHFNDFRVIYGQPNGGNEKAYAYVRVIGSIGTNHYNNPSFIKADIDADDNIVAETPYYLDLGDATWKSNYGIATVGLSKIDAAGMLQYIEANKDKVSSTYPINYIQFHSMDKVNRDKGIASTLTKDLLPVK